jgi:hypothetical protein
MIISYMIITFLKYPGIKSRTFIRKPGIKGIQENNDKEGRKAGIFFFTMDAAGVLLPGIATGMKYQKMNLAISRLIL